MGSVKVKLFTQNKKQDGNYPLVFEIIYKRKRKVIRTGLNVLPEQWDERQNLLITRNSPGKVKYNVIGSSTSQLNFDITQKLNRYRGLVDAAELNNESFDLLVSKLMSKGPVSLFDFIETIVSNLVASKKMGNSKAYQSLLDQLKKHSKDVPLKEVTYNYVNDFKTSKYVAGNSNNTLRYYLKTFRAVINEAIRQGSFEQSDYPFKKGLIPPETPTAKRFLTSKEIKKIEEYKPTSSSYQKAKDVFLLGFYLRGADIVDLAQLTESNYQRDRIEYKRQKSGQLLSIKIIPKARKILDKYKGQRYLLPILKVGLNEDRQNYHTRTKNINRSLKKIGTDLKLPITLTTKVNRHSWATIAKTKGISKDIIKEALGHQDKVITDVYLGAYEPEVLDKANIKVCNK